MKKNWNHVRKVGKGNKSGKQWKNKGQITIKETNKQDKRK
jgi:hypothetical protein